MKEPHEAKLYTKLAKASAAITSRVTASSALRALRL